MPGGLALPTARCARFVLLNVVLCAGSFCRWVLPGYRVRQFIPISILIFSTQPDAFATDFVSCLQLPTSPAAGAIPSFTTPAIVLLFLFIVKLSLPTTTARITPVDCPPVPRMPFLPAFYHAVTCFEFIRCLADACRCRFGVCLSFFCVGRRHTMRILVRFFPVYTVAKHLPTCRYLLGALYHTHALRCRRALPMTYYPFVRTLCDACHVYSPHATILADCAPLTPIAVRRIFLTLTAPELVRHLLNDHQPRYCCDAEPLPDLPFLCHRSTTYLLPCCYCCIRSPVYRCCYAGVVCSVAFLLNTCVRFVCVSGRVLRLVYRFHNTSVSLPAFFRFVLCDRV